jgi:hypothetical protein
MGGTFSKVIELFSKDIELNESEIEEDEAEDEEECYKCLCGDRDEPETI